MGSGAWESAKWALENTPSKDTSDAEWEMFAMKADEFCKKYIGEPEYDMVLRNIKARCDAVFEGVPIIQNEPIRLNRGLSNAKDGRSF